MQYVVKETVEYREADMPKIYWKRHKKPTVSLIDDCPFTIDRQLEDQKYLQEFNRNPRVNISTKIDKTRSEKIISKIGASSVLATKAKVLNKFVREASGINSYAMVPPPRIKDNSFIKDIFDPETHPLVKPYRLESQKKPVMCSFGHRPKSASRTFFPATMNVRLKHNEIISTDNNNKTGIGLSVSTLGKLLHAPKLLYPNQLEADEKEEEERKRALIYDDTAVTQSPSISHLSRTSSPNNSHSHSHSHSNNNNNNNIDQNISIERKRTNSVESISIFGDDSVYSTLPPGGIKTRPDWNEGFHNIIPNPAELYSLKSSGGMNDINLTLQQRMNRFSSLTIAERQINPFCSEKQINDWIESSSGTAIKVKKAIPVKGVQEYFDPLKEQFIKVKEYHEQEMQRKYDQKKKIEYITEVKLIPTVPYFPDDIANELKKYDPLLTDNNNNNNNGIIGENAFISSPSILQPLKTNNITKKVLKGIYTSNFIAPKDIDTGLNTSMEDFEPNNLIQLQKSKNLFRYEDNNNLDTNNKNNNNNNKNKNKKLLIKQNSLHNIENILQNDPILEKLDIHINFTKPTKLKPLNQISKTAPEINFQNESLSNTNTNTIININNSTMSSIPINQNEITNDSMFFNQLNTSSQTFLSSPSLSLNNINNNILTESQKLEKTLRNAKRGDVQALYKHFMIDKTINPISFNKTM